MHNTNSPDAKFLLDIKKIRLTPVKTLLTRSFHTYSLLIASKNKFY